MSHSSQPSPSPTRAARHCRATNLRERVAWRSAPVVLLVFVSILTALQIPWSWTAGRLQSLSSHQSDQSESIHVFPVHSQPQEQVPVQSDQTQQQLTSLPDPPPPSLTPPPCPQRLSVEPIVVPDLELPSAPPEQLVQLTPIEDQFADRERVKPQRDTAKRPPTKKARHTPNPRQKQARQLASHRAQKPTPKATRASASSGLIAKTKPRYRSAPKPPYPVGLRSRRAEGTVRVRISVSAAGRPTNVSVIGSSGFREFDSTASSWILSRWRFEPATENGRAIASIVTTRIHFTLRS